MQLQMHADAKIELQMKANYENAASDAQEVGKTMLR